MSATTCCDTRDAAPHHANEGSIADRESLMAFDQACAPYEVFNNAESRLSKSGSGWVSDVRTERKRRSSRSNIEGTPCSDRCSQHVVPLTSWSGHGTAS